MGQSQSDRHAPAGQPYMGQPLVCRHAKIMGDLLLEDLKIRDFIKKECSGRCGPCDHRTSAQEVPRDNSHQHAPV
jgi:hypothetical protein